MNWFNTDTGRKNLEKIETKSTNEEEFNKNRLTYHFHLNAKAISTIKEYNAYVNNYNALIAGSYTKNNDESGPASEYHSKFIEDFYNDRIQLYKPSGNTYVTYGSPVRLNTKSSGGDSALKIARDRVHWNGENSRSE